ncbi:MAG: hypothetical protein KatS3mg050_3364 [Litorilinea sp.]|nr:MAG: hypothetical protein KatS3mg050_3364 [Litorilinea sp.]
MWTGRVLLAAGGRGLARAEAERDGRAMLLT